MLAPAAGGSGMRRRNTSSSVGSGARQRQDKAAAQRDAMLRAFLDGEDERVKQLTEGILYELLPAALHVMLPSGDDPLTQLDAERCRVRVVLAAGLQRACQADTRARVQLVCRRDSCSRCGQPPPPAAADAARLLLVVLMCCVCVRAGCRGRGAGGGLLDERATRLPGVSVVHPVAPAATAAPRQPHSNHSTS
jgi:hypothetical protein